MSKLVTPHFAWHEFLDSDLANANDISNIPGDYEKSNIVNVARILERVREDFGHPLVINSGYRCKELNSIVPGASADSYHLEGRAVDIVVSGYKDYDKVLLYDILCEYHPVEIYQKGDSYVHVAF